jgi:hypothetical protein
MNWKELRGKRVFHYGYKSAVFFLEGRNEIKCKAIPFKAWTGAACSRWLRLPDFEIIGEGNMVVKPAHQPPLPRKNFCYSCLLEGRCADEGYFK